MKKKVVGIAGVVGGVVAAAAAGALAFVKSKGKKYGTVNMDEIPAEDAEFEVVDDAEEEPQAEEQ